ncbi:MAG: hypothetical protein PF689_11495 [Deltaproteobacteria bacterium]|nr:hypothetical protein [Deltaproteobacteria bacterium]
MKRNHQVVAGINKQKPDLVVITGDLVDGAPDKLGYLVQVGLVPPFVWAHHPKYPILL